MLFDTLSNVCVTDQSAKERRDLWPDVQLFLKKDTFQDIELSVMAISYSFIPVHEYSIDEGIETKLYFKFTVKQ